MKIEVKLKEATGYIGVVRVFRGWRTAQQWIQEALLADGPEIEVVIKVVKEPEAELPFQDVSASDVGDDIERVLR